MKDTAQLRDKAVSILRQLNRFKVLLFCLLLLITYGFIMYRISVLNSVQPSDTDIANKSKTATLPKIDENLISQIHNLQDNSVSVQALFDQARNSPFQEQ